MKQAFIKKYCFQMDSTSLGFMLETFQIMTANFLAVLVKFISTILRLDVENMNHHILTMGAKIGS